MGKCILAGHPPVGGQIGYGTYTGNGAASQFINLGVTPKWVLVAPHGNFNNATTGNAYSAGLAVDGYPLTSGSDIYLEVAAGGLNRINSVRLHISEVQTQAACFIITSTVPDHRTPARGCA